MVNRYQKCLHEFSELGPKPEGKKYGGPQCVPVAKLQYELVENSAHPHHRNRSEMLNICTNFNIHLQKTFEI